MTCWGQVYNFKEMTVSTQTDGTCTSERLLHTGKWNFDESIKTACALSCVNAGTTTEQACKAFQTTSEVFFNMKYQLSSKTDEDEPLPKKPRTSDHYLEHYTNVLPSPKSHCRYKIFTIDSARAKCCSGSYWNIWRGVNDNTPLWYHNKKKNQWWMTIIDSYNGKW